MKLKKGVYLTKDGRLFFLDKTNKGFCYYMQFYGEVYGNPRYELHTTKSGWYKTYSTIERPSYENRDEKPYSKLVERLKKAEYLGRL
jgi:hypothetical protein